MAWIPHITVASIIEQNNKFLFVEEYVNNLKVLNQPAGHLEEHETLENGCIRETLEETAFCCKSRLSNWYIPGKSERLKRYVA